MTRTPKRGKSRLRSPAKKYNFTSCGDRSVKTAIEKLRGVKASKAVVVGDTAYDAATTTTVKIKVVGVLTGGWTRTELLETGCVEVYRDAAEILKQYKDSIFTQK